MYCSSVWTLTSKANLDSVLKLQRRAARVILYKDSRASSVPIFNRLRWLSFYKEAEIYSVCILFKRVLDGLPDYMADLHIRNSDIHSRSTRYNEFNFVCPSFKYVTEAGHSFTVKILN